MMQRITMGFHANKVRGIEFFGLPGSGKSTVMHAAHRALMRDGFPAVATNDGMSQWLLRKGRLGRLKMVLLSTETVARHWRVAVPLAWSLGGTGVAPMKRALLCPLYSIYLNRFLLEYNGFFTTDQGALQGIWSILALATSHDEGLLSETIRLAVRSTPLAYVYVKADPRLAAERVAGRVVGASRFDGRSLEENTRRFQHSQTVFELVQAELTAGCVNLLLLDAEESVEAKALLVGDFIRHLQATSACRA
jgi:hypothetical protein